MESTQQPQYFDLHTSGVGYLNRIRWVEPLRRGGRQADRFLACSISALRGNTEAPAYTPFDLRVSGEEAIQMIGQLEKDVQERRKVVLSFKVGDIYPHLYERDVRDRETGQKTGEREMAVLIKGRLLLINTITIDGDRVFTREASNEAPESDPPSQAAEATQREPEERAAPVQKAARPVQARPAQEAASQPRYERKQPVPSRPQALQGGERPAYQRAYAVGRAVNRGAQRFTRAAQEAVS